MDVPVDIAIGETPLGDSLLDFAERLRQLSQAN
jgi:hypothetical protein